VKAFVSDGVKLDHNRKLLIGAFLTELHHLAAWDRRRPRLLRNISDLRVVRGRAPYNRSTEPLCHIPVDRADGSCGMRRRFACTFRMPATHPRRSSFQWHQARSKASRTSASSRSQKSTAAPAISGPRLPSAAVRSAKRSSPLPISDAS
jgi:hypothetical protein